MVFLIGFFGVFILGLIVFGGGQVFMPLYKSLWGLLEKNGTIIDENKIENIFTITNSTPGVISTKFAAFTGYLIANGEWWGWLTLFLTYLIFAIPSIIMIIWSYKAITKTEEHKYLKNVIVYLKPVVIGILLSLAIQLFISTAIPMLKFNSGSEYSKVVTTKKSSFFNGWRLYALIAYTVIVIPETFFLYKRKVNLFWLLISHIILGLIVFQPWLN